MTCLRKAFFEIISDFFELFISILVQRIQPRGGWGDDSGKADIPQKYPETPFHLFLKSFFQHRKKANHSNITVDDVAVGVVVVVVVVDIKVTSCCLLTKLCYTGKLKVPLG